MTIAPKPYHHGDLRNTLLSAARTILEEEGLATLSLRGVARKAGVSHAAPYRHFQSHDELLSEIAIEGFAELRLTLSHAWSRESSPDEIITRIGGAYIRFFSQRPALARLMFGSQLPNRESFPGLAAAADAIGEEIGAALEDPVRGLAVWAAIHGLAVLILENVIDLGQHRSGLDVLPSRAEILLRSLLVTSRQH